ncbi:hypothetical protein 1 [Hubei tombus-like virus 38]|uniref:hypothetical protein 1 n=1 Tax=Hubei tombus-like virus 38 TaxID=1923286 RepID=UPI00090A22EC|nr:hypothetical protein 1 [Hubei tombus-like virus 38]APG76564.1 hypothetical protein 1 [Hubei tombus-like virus 38]
MEAATLVVADNQMDRNKTYARVVQILRSRMASRQADMTILSEVATITLRLADNINRDAVLSGNFRGTILDYFDRRGWVAYYLIAPLGTWLPRSVWGWMLSKMTSREHRFNRWVWPHVSATHCSRIMSADELQRIRGALTAIDPGARQPPFQEPGLVLNAIHSDPGTDSDGTHGRPRERDRIPSNPSSSTRAETNRLQSSQAAGNESEVPQNEMPIRNPNNRGRGRSNRRRGRQRPRSTTALPRQTSQTRGRIRQGSPNSAPNIDPATTVGRVRNEVQTRRATAPNRRGSKGARHFRGQL